MMHAEIPADTTTLVWDLDGTLLDSFGIYQACLNQTLREHGLHEVPEQVLRNNHHGFIDDTIAQVLRETGQAVSEDKLAAIIDGFYTLDNVYIKDADRHLFEDAVDLAERAHAAGLRQIVVTNRPHGVDRGNGSPRNLVRHSRLNTFMNDVLCGDDSEHRKPERAFLEARYGRDLSSLGKIVVIGDQFVDAELARNLDGNAVLVSRAEEVAHLDRLGDWHEYVQIVRSLSDVLIAAA